MKFVIKLLVSAVLLFLFLNYSPTLIEVDPKAANVPLPVGDLKQNYILNDAERLYEGLLSGPESLAFHNGEMYSGLEDGRIVKLKSGEIITLAMTGRPCRLPYEHKLCGRPLGLRVGKDGLLYIVDAFYGLLSMNFTTNALTRVLPMDVKVDGHPLTFPDDMDIDEEGNIYFSDASQKWGYTQMMHLVLEHDGSGRVIKHNTKTGESTVAVKNVFFPNGVQLSKDKKSILISECLKRRILRHYVKGPKKGHTEVFADNLLAEPDNIRRSPRGYWVAFTSARNASNPSLQDMLAPYPIIKRILLRALHAIGSVLVPLADLTSWHEFQALAYKIKIADAGLLVPLVPRYGLIMEFDEKGGVLRSLQSPDGKESFFSQATEEGGYLYLASYLNNYVGKLKL